MNTLHFTSILLITLLVLLTLFAASVKVFFTDDELNEMGVRIEHTSMNADPAPA